MRGEAPLNLTDVADRGDDILAEIERAVVGKRHALSLILMSLLAGGHVLLEDYPGLAKTLTARSFARVLGLSFKRIQFTPDLLPADVVGTYILRREKEEFELRPGPIFAQIILADEINRATPRTQSALLEAMQEGQVTLEGETHPLPQPFMVLATQNPIEYEGTFALPEAQLDRFLIRARFGYPARSDEVEILSRRITRRAPEETLKPVTCAEELLEMRAAVEDVHVDPDLLEYMARLTEATRDHASVEVGASPRGTLALLLLSRARAAMEGRDYVIPDDIKQVAVPALVHRLIIRPELWQQQTKPEQVIQGTLDRVPVPKAERWGATRS
ncbi:MAG: MoxR family ATPase [Dehalococcoidia bacterium]|nr:MoxR family ATPase [Dehalococcoidia bacterium]